MAAYIDFSAELLDFAAEAGFRYVQRCVNEFDAGER